MPIKLHCVNLKLGYHWSESKIKVELSCSGCAIAASIALSPSDRVPRREDGPDSSHDAACPCRDTRQPSVPAAHRRSGGPALQHATQARVARVPPSPDLCTCGSRVTGNSLLLGTRRGRDAQKSRQHLWPPAVGCCFDRQSGHSPAAQNSRRLQLGRRQVSDPRMPAPLATSVSRSRKPCSDAAVDGSLAARPISILSQRCGTEHDRCVSMFYSFSLLNLCRRELFCCWPLKAGQHIARCQDTHPGEQEAIGTVWRVRSAAEFLPRALRRGSRLLQVGSATSDSRWSADRGACGGANTPSAARKPGQQRHTCGAARRPNIHHALRRFRLIWRVRSI